MKYTEYIITIGEEAQDYDEMFIGVIRRQPELVRCKDCKYYSYSTIEGKHLCMSVKYRFTPTAEDEWCSRAERKEDLRN